MLTDDDRAEYIVNACDMTVGDFGNYTKALNKRIVNTYMEVYGANNASVVTEQVEAVQQQIEARNKRNIQQIESQTDLYDIPIVPDICYQNAFPIREQLVFEL